MERARRSWHPGGRGLTRTALSLLLSLCLSWLAAVAIAAPAARAEAPIIKSSGTASPAAAAGPMTVTVGLHVRNLYGLSLRDQTFKADGWFWLKVPPQVQALMQRRGIEPLEMVEFVNQVDHWDALIEQLDEEQPSAADGSRLFVFRFAGNFYVNEIDQRRSPFESIHLPLILETNPESFVEPASRVQLLPEPGTRGLLGDYSSIYGYQLRRVRLQPSDHHYPTSFGKFRDQTYSRLELLVDYSPDPWAMFTQWILPLLLVMCLVLLAPSLEGTLGDARLAIPPTALLTLVFMQQSYKAELPPTSYLTFLDQLYVYGYVVSVGLFVLFLWGSNQMEAATVDQRERVMRRINRVDLRCQIAALSGFVLVALIAWHR